MISIYEFYQRDINESFSSNLVRMFKQDLVTCKANRRYNKSFHDLFYYCTWTDLVWDKITDDDIFVWDNADDRDKFLRFFRAVRSHKPDFDATKGGKRVPIPIKDHSIVIFGYIGGELHCLYSSRLDRVYCLDQSSSPESYNRPNEMADHMSVCNKWYVINVSDRSADKIRSDRSQAARDSVPDLSKGDRSLKHTLQGKLGVSVGGIDWGQYKGWNEDDKAVFFKHCEDLIKATRERYKKIIAQNRFDRTADTKEIDDIVKKCTDLYLELLGKYSTDRESANAMYNINKLFQGEVKAWAQSAHKATGYVQGGLLGTYNKYIEAVKYLKENSNYPAMYLEQRDNSANSIKYIYKKIQEYAKNVK